MLSHEKTIEEIREDWRRSSKKSYDANKIKAARKRIMLNIDDGKCVQEKTLNDPKYKWTEHEKAMLRKCLQLRRENYYINPDQIKVIVDNRYRKSYPKNHLRLYEEGLKHKYGEIQNEINKVTELLNDDNTDATKKYLKKELNKLNKLLGKPTNVLDNVLNRDEPIPFGENRMNVNTQLSPETMNVNVNNAIRTPNSNVIMNNVNIENFYSKEAFKHSIYFLIDYDFILVNKPEHAKRKERLESSRVIESVMKTLNSNENVKYIDLKTNNIYDFYTQSVQYVKYFSENIPNKTKFLYMLYQVYNFGRKNKFKEWKEKENRIQIKYGRFPKILNNFCCSNENKKKHESYWKPYIELHDKIKTERQKRLAYRKKYEPYYNWKDLQIILDKMEIELLKNDNDELDYTKMEIMDLQKLIIMYIYLKENVLRDNLVQLKIKRNYQSGENSNYIYKLLTGEYVIVLNYYKNQNDHGEQIINISKKVSNLIDLLIEKRNAKDINYEYLFVQNNGDMYKNGLSQVIQSITKQQTGFVIGINDIRASVATYYKNLPQSFEDYLNNKNEKSFTISWVPISMINTYQDIPEEVKKTENGKEFRIFTKTDLAKQMSHKLETHINTYERDSKIKYSIWRSEINKSFLGKMITVETSYQGKWKYLNGTVKQSSSIIRTTETPLSPNDNIYSILFDKRNIKTNSLKLNALFKRSFQIRTALFHPENDKVYKVQFKEKKDYYLDGEFNYQKFVELKSKEPRLNTYSFVIFLYENGKVNYNMFTMKKLEDLLFYDKLPIIDIEENDDIEYENITEPNSQ